MTGSSEYRARMEQLKELGARINQNTSATICMLGLNNTQITDDGEAKPKDALPYSLLHVSKDARVTELP